MCDTHACTHARTHTCMHARTYAHMHARTHARTHTHTHTHTHTYLNMYPQEVVHSVAVLLKNEANQFNKMHPVYITCMVHVVNHVITHDTMTESYDRIMIARKMTFVTLVLQLNIKVMGYHGIPKVAVKSIY